MTARYEFEDDMENTIQPGQTFDFIEATDIFGKILFVLMNIGIFSYVLFNLFTIEQPILSALASVFIGMFAAICISPLTAFAAYLLAIAFSGVLAFANRPKTL